MKVIFIFPASLDSLSLLTILCELSSVSFTITGCANALLDLLTPCSQGLSSSEDFQCSDPVFRRTAKHLAACPGSLLEEAFCS